MKNDKTDNVIDMTSRIPETDPNDRQGDRLSRLKVRLDLEHAKIAVSTSLLSIVVLVTLANNNLMSMSTVTATGINVAANEYAITKGSRGIASVSNTNEKQALSEDPEIARELAKRDLSPKASVGRKPTQLEKLAFEYLEGKYAVRLQNGKLKEIELSEASFEPKQVDNLARFIDEQRALLPAYDRSQKIADGLDGAEHVQTFQLLNQVSMPVARVQFRLDGEGRLLTMRVSSMNIASR